MLVCPRQLGFWGNSRQLGVTTCAMTHPGVNRNPCTGPPAPRPQAGTLPSSPFCKVMGPVAILPVDWASLINHLWANLCVWLYDVQDNSL